MEQEKLIAKGNCEKIGLEGSMISLKANGEQKVFDVVSLLCHPEDNTNSSLISHISQLITMENKNIWGKIINIVITVLTAIATTFGVTSCIGV